MKHTLTLIGGLTIIYGLLFLLAFLTVYEWWVKWSTVAAYLFTAGGIIRDKYIKSRAKE